MSKTLTLHNTNEGNGEHWYSRQNEYCKKEIDGIIDPEGGNTKEPPTSIPSPFARFDLVRTAFAKLSQNETLNGEPNDERLVSECFDVGQIFFNYDKLKDKVKIIKWDKAIGLASLKNSPLIGHKRFGKALDLFIKQDGGTAKASDDDKRSGGYNFDLMDAVFILRYTDEKDSGIIGGTSPSTIFFSSPNDLSFVDIQFGNDKLFDKDLCPLHKRDVEYQKFWHGLSKQPNFMKHFPEVSSYLKRSLDLLKKDNNVAWQQIGTDAEKLTSSVYNDLFEDLVSQSGDLVTALEGFRIKKVKVDPAQLAISDFIIPSEKYSRLYPDKLKPMILQNNYQGRLIYSKDYWNKDQPVPSYMAEDWRENKRRLPGQQDFYPWLTVSDFLEPNIIRLVYPINNDCFFNGGLSGGNELTKSYLLPLKKDFFDFFDVEDLTIGQGRKVGIKMENLAGESAVKVTLSIPLKVGQPPIILERIYKASINDIPLIADESKKDGGSIVELQFGVNLMPFLRIDSPGFSPLYRVQVVDRDIDYLTLSNDYNLKFVDSGNQILNISPPKERSKKRLNAGVIAATTKYYNIQKNFDYISVEVGGKKGIIVPRFDKVSKPLGTKKLTFAIDFGTTNTHIEYKDEQQNLFPFEINKEDSTIATLHEPSLRSLSFINGMGAAILADIIPVEMIPERINKDEKAFFPTRTALLENTPSGTKSPYSFLEYNPALLYEKQNLDLYNVVTNLKWLDESDEKGKIRIEAYIESLLLLIRNKILVLGGNLENTELVWFYPLSMSGDRLENFEKRWCKCFKNIISSTTYPKPLPESTAPFYWYSSGTGSSTKVKTTTYPAASIDIGGGTSDVVIFKDNNPNLISSFRFAANAIFGDAFSEFGAANRNGFVQKYENTIKQKLESNNLIDLARAYQTIRNKQKSEDVIAFFFSLKDNKDVQNKTDIDFNEILSEDKTFKIIFFVFYCAIIYHLACIMKAKQYKMPRYISFSGNGSKVLKILSGRNSNLSALAKLIFEKVYEDSYHTDGLDIVIDHNTPKEATCKGGLMYSSSINFTIDPNNDTNKSKELKRIKAVLLGTNREVFVNDEDIYSTFNEKLFVEVEQEVKNFVDLIFSLKGENIDIEDDFGIKKDNFELYKNKLTSDLNQNIRDGFNKKKRDSGEKKIIEESLFFYPLIEGINNLATEIAK